MYGYYFHDFPSVQSRLHVYFFGMKCQFTTFPAQKIDVLKVLDSNIVILKCPVLAYQAYFFVFITNLMLDQQCAKLCNFDCIKMPPFIKSFKRVHLIEK